MLISIFAPFKMADEADAEMAGGYLMADAKTAEGDEGCCIVLTGVYCYAKVLILQST